MQIKSWQIAIFAFIFEVIGLVTYLLDYKRCSVGEHYCRTLVLEIKNWHSLLIFIFLIILILLLYKDKKRIGALLGIFLGLVEIMYGIIFYSITLDTNYNNFTANNAGIVYCLISGIILLVTGLYYFWKKV